MLWRSGQKRKLKIRNVDSGVREEDV